MTYWWVVGWGRPGTRLDGKRALFGAFYSSSRAQRFADKLPGETTVYDFSTRSTAKATQCLKEKGVEIDPDNWEEQSARVRHPKSIDYE